MEGPIDGHIYATVNSIKSDCNHMISPSPNQLDPGQRSSHAQPYPSHPHSHPHHNSSRSPRQLDPGNMRMEKDDRNPTPIYVGPRKSRDPDYQPHQSGTTQECVKSKRIAPMWSPSSDICSDQQPNDNMQPKSAHYRSATQAEIEKLDDLLLELTPRLNDSPSEYTRRRRQSFSNSSNRISNYEGRNRQDTFIQGFSPTSPIETRELNSGMTNVSDSYQQHQTMSASLARAPLVERSSSHSNLDMGPRQKRLSSWHTEEKKRLHRARSLLDEKDRLLTEQLRRFQMRTSLAREGYSMSPMGNRPGSSQQIIMDSGMGRYNYGGRDYGPLSDWEDVRMFADQYPAAQSRRANSEMDYPLRDVPLERTANSPVVGAVNRRRPFIRHYSEKDEFGYPRPRNNSDNYARQQAVSYARSYSPHNYRYSNGSPAHPDMGIEMVEDIPLVQRRNLRTNLHNNRLGSNDPYFQDLSPVARIRTRTTESLPMSVLPPSGPLSPPPGNMDSGPVAVMGNSIRDVDKNRNTPDMVGKPRNSGFQIRAEGSARTSGISYHDPDEAYLSSDGYPAVSKIPLSNSPTSQMIDASTKSAAALNQRKSHQRSDEMQNSYPPSRDGLMPTTNNQDGQHGRSTRSATATNNSSSHNSSIRKTAKIWYQPHMCREDAIKYLKSKPTGSFIIRQSHTFNNSYGLAVKVPKTSSSSEDNDRCIRHFLIESNNKGVRIRGCANEPYFGSLTALVHQHTLTKLALPCPLVLPNSDSDADEQQVSVDSSTKLSAPKVSALFATKTFSALYLGSIDTESLTGAAALNRAVDVLLENRNQVKQTEVSIRISPEGVTLTDVLRKLFFRRHYPLTSISYCGMENTAYWDSQEIRSRGISKARIFGFVARKTSTNENMCHLLCEWHTPDNARMITTFISGCLTNT